MVAVTIIAAEVVVLVAMEDVTGSRKTLESSATITSDNSTVRHRTIVRRGEEARMHQMVVTTMTVTATIIVAQQLPIANVITALPAAQQIVQSSSMMNTIVTPSYPLGQRHPMPYRTYLYRRGRLNHSSRDVEDLRIRTHRCCQM